MIGRLNHVAIAVPDLPPPRPSTAMLGARVSAPVAQPAHGVTTVFIELPNTKIELLHPLGAGVADCRLSPAPSGGGLHHVCYEVADILAARDRLIAAGARVLGDGEPKIGAHDSRSRSCIPRTSAAP